MNLRLKNIFTNPKSSFLGLLIALFLIWKVIEWFEDGRLTGEELLALLGLLCSSVFGFLFGNDTDHDRNTYKNTHTFKCLMFCGLMLGLCSGNAQQVPPKLECWVTSVHDGDTFSGVVLGKKQHFRLCNVDAPELEQAFGKTAQKKLDSLIGGKRIGYIFRGYDRYKRVLAEGAINHLSIDSLLVSNGWAWYYKQYGTKPYLEGLQNQAKYSKRGLWACGESYTMYPSDFRSLAKKYRIKITMQKPLKCE
jgi:endonuclease YncB( thermonuclease family)